MAYSAPRVVRRGNRFYFRVAVPLALVHRLGQRELKLSLRTSSIIEARLHGRALSSAVDLLFEELRRMPHITPEQVQQRVRAYFQLCLNRSHEQALLLPHDETVDLGNEVAFLRKQMEALRVQLVTSKFEPSVLSDALALIGASTKGERADQDALMIAQNGVLRARIENARILAAMLTGNYEATAPADPLFKGMAPNDLPPAIGDAPQPTANDLTLAAAADLFYSAKTKHDWTGKTAADVKRVLALAQSVIGDKPIRFLTVEDVRDVRDALAALPPNFMKAKATKQLSVTDAVASNKAGKALSLKTQDKYLTMFKALLIWADHEGYIDKVPGAGVKVAGVGKTNPAEQRDPYSIEQLKVIFSSPLYRGHTQHSRHKPGPLLTKDGKYWVPLIALMSGMRMGEIVQLQHADLRQEHGIWLFDVSKGEDKTLKTASSKRKVPVHPLLVDLGILDLVKTGKPKGRLFPDIEPGADGYFSHNLSKWWGRFSRQVGFATPKTAFHSFRHNFKDALVIAEVPDETRKALMGHADKSVHSIYGSGVPLSLLKGAVDKIVYVIDLKDFLGKNAPSS